MADRFSSGDSPNRTAEYMALFRAVETAERADRRLFDDPHAAAFLTGQLKALAGFARLPVADRLATWFRWPRTRSSAVVRTRPIDHLVRQAVHSDARQALLPGAGFDSRPYRLEELRGVPLFDVDHPATQKAKRERLEASLGPLPANVRFVPVDFEKDDLEAALPSAGFYTGAVTLACRGKSSVRSSGKPFIFGFDPAALADYLRPRGFALVSDASTAEAAKSYCQPIRRSEPGSELYRIAAARRTAV